MNSFVLLIAITFNNGVMATNSYSYNTIDECTSSLSRVMAQDYPFKLKASCHVVIPEVPEVDSDKVSVVG